MTLLDRDQAISPSIFIVAFGTIMLMLAGTRAFVRMLADGLRRHPEGSERVLIYGAGVGGELALREIRSNAALGKDPVGFIDDDPLRRGMTIHGVPVLGSLTELEHIVGQHHMAAILISTGKLTADRQARLSAVAGPRTPSPCITWTSAWHRSRELQRLGLPIDD